LRKKVLPLAFVLLLGFALVLSGCGGNAAPADPPAPPAPPAGQAETPPTPPPAVGKEMGDFKWTQDNIASIPPMLIRDPFIELLGQTDQPIPYYYDEVVKLAGHSCGATASSWLMVQKVFDELFPNEVPIRGKIKITAPGPADEWLLGVFGDIFCFLTGAAGPSGFPGTEFGKTFNRRNTMIYPEEQNGGAPPTLVWVFERIDTGKKVGVKFAVTNVQPQPTAERQEMSGKLVDGTATDEERADWVKYWNSRNDYVFEHADELITLVPME